MRGSDFGMPGLNSPWALVIESALTADIFASLLFCFALLTNRSNLALVIASKIHQKIENLEHDI